MAAPIGHRHSHRGDSRGAFAMGGGAIWRFDAAAEFEETAVKAAPLSALTRGGISGSAGPAGAAAQAPRRRRGMAPQSSMADTVPPAHVEHGRPDFTEVGIYRDKSAPGYPLGPSPSTPPRMLGHRAEIAMPTWKGSSRAQSGGLFQAKTLRCARPSSAYAGGDGAARRDAGGASGREAAHY